MISSVSRRNSNVDVRRTLLTPLNSTIVDRQKVSIISVNDRQKN